jgi:hypothetical protein
MKAVGVDAKVLEQLKSLGWAVQMTAKKLVLAKEGSEISTPITSEMIHKAYSGELMNHPIMLSALENLAMEAINIVGFAIPKNKVSSLKFEDVFDQSGVLEAAKLGPATEQLLKAATAAPPATTQMVKQFFAANLGLPQSILINSYAKKFGVSAFIAADAVQTWLNGHATVVATGGPSSTFVVVNSGSFPTFDLAKMETSPPVKLRDANMMYQPVKGSSDGSRYFMIAANKDVRIAARFKADKLGIRIEGPNWKKHLSGITQLGIVQDSGGKDYASLHLEIHDIVVAKKTMGAILMGLSLPLDTPMPNMEVIYGKGS